MSFTATNKALIHSVPEERPNGSAQSNHKATGAALLPANRVSMGPTLKLEAEFITSCWK
jgi:hypothetical protein